MNAEEIEKIKMAGYIAYGQGLDLSDNPEKRGTNAYAAWGTGWNKADDDDGCEDADDDMGYDDEFDY